MAELSVDAGMRLEDAAPLAVADPVAPAVVETPETETREIAVNPRDAAMARINENRQKVLDHELLYAEDMAADATEHLHPGEAVEPVESPAVVEPIVAASAPIVAEAPTSVEPARRTIQIGGQSYSVTDQELEQLAIYGAQSLSNQGQPAPQLQHPTEPLPQPQAGPILHPDFARSVAKRIAFGDEEDGARALEDLVSGVIRNVQGPAVPTVDQVVQQAIPIMQARQDYADTLTRLGEEFNDVFSDTGLSTLAGIEARNLIQKNSLLRQEKPYSEVYREACQTVRDRYIAPRQSQPRPETTQTALQAAPNSRLESKRAAPRPPASAGRTASLGIDQNQIPTGSEVVNRMRQARGQPAYN